MPRKLKTASGTALGVRIGRNIKRARAQLSMTQAELAEFLGLENVTVSRIETGAQLPSIDRLDAIAKALQVSLTTLVAADTDKSAVADLLVDVVRDLPIREQTFVHAFASTYAAHYRAGKVSKKK